MATVREVVERIDARLAKLGGMTDREASRLSGQPDRIRGLRRRLEDGKGDADVTERTVRPLAAALKTTAKWLDSGDGPEDADGQSPPLACPEASSNEPSDAALVDIPILQAGLESAMLTGGMPPDRAAKFAAALIEKARQRAAKLSSPLEKTPQSRDL